MTMCSVFCFLGALAVAMGAFGAHALKNKVTEERLAVWVTANHYHLAHCVAGAVLALGFSSLAVSNRMSSIALWFFIAGIFFFSGSLYLLVLLNLPLLGAVAPIGGLSFIMGWLLSGSAFFLCKNSSAKLIQ